jgi:glycosyltransferase involved in cell wall biosynthesis
MKIAVNVRFLIKDKLEGIGIFTNETLRRITTNHKEHQFYFLFDRKFDEEFIYSDNITPIIVNPAARHPILWHLWFEYSMPNAINKIKPDIFVSTDGFLSLKSKIKSLAVIHDIAFEHYPKDVPWMVGKFYRYYFPKYAAKANRIATVSEFTKNDIISKYKIAQDKIDVVYNGSSSIFKPINQAEKKTIKDHLTNGCDYFVYVGAMHARKNIANLLKAYDIFRESSDKKLKLVLVGRMAWQTSEITKTFEKLNFKEDIIFTGRVSDKDLANYVGAAYAMTYLSYFEGFGIPPLEAMYSDIPVISSNTSSLPEVVGNAALQVNPFNIEEIAKALKVLAENENLQKDLIAKGRMNRNQFSWDKTAELLWESILKTSLE